MVMIEAQKLHKLENAMIQDVNHESGQSNHIGNVLMLFDKIKTVNPLGVVLRLNQTMKSIL